MAGFENALIELWPEGAPNAAGTTDEDRPALTTYLVEGSKGAVIVCPGGGYGVRAEHEGRPIAEWLNGIGISAFVLRYRVAPYRHPNPLLDAQRAIRYVRLHAAEWGLDEGRIGILGFSAGGHLASTAGTQYDAGNPDASIRSNGCRAARMRSSSVMRSSRCRRRSGTAVRGMICSARNPARRWSRR